MNKKNNALEKMMSKKDAPPEDQWDQDRMQAMLRDVSLLQDKTLLGLGLAVQRVVVGVHPAVEDPDVVVRRDEGHEPRDKHRRLVLLHDGGHPHPEKECARHHAGQREGESIVHNLVLLVAHREHRHGCERRMCAPSGLLRFPLRVCV